MSGENYLDNEGSIFRFDLSGAACASKEVEDQGSGASGEGCRNINADEPNADLINRAQTGRDQVSKSPEMRFLPAVAATSSSSVDATCSILWGESESDHDHASKIRTEGKGGVLRRESWMRRSSSSLATTTLYPIVCFP